MAVNLMLAITTLINKGELEQCPNIGAFACKGDENGDISRVIFRVFPIWVEINCPLVATHREILTGYVLSNSYALSKRIPLYDEVVRAVHGVGHRPRA